MLATATLVALGAAVNTRFCYYRNALQHTTQMITILIKLQKVVFKKPNTRRWLAAIMLVVAATATLPATGADPDKVLHVLLAEAEAGLDPATASDASTLSITENIFDALLRYDYLARPVRLQGNTAALPQISADGLTYTFHLIPGIRFTDDAAFGQRPRELTAADYVYSIQRLYDPAIQSPWLFLFAHKLEGDAALTPAPGARFDVDTPIAGLQALDRYTLQIRLQRPDGNLAFALATPASAAVAREVVQAHAGAPGNHPVGTGPYQLALWQRNHRIVLDANPHYKKTLFTNAVTEPAGAAGAASATATAATIAAADRAIVQALRGRALPLIGHIDIRIMEEQQARVLGFLNREFDYLEPLPAPLTSMALADGHLLPALQQRGIRLATVSTLRTFYLWMNMEDPVLGGYTPARIALRRAIAMAYDQAEDIRLLDQGMALAAQSPVPPQVRGYDAGYRSSSHHDPALAARLLDHFGYRVRGSDGYRSAPDGSPLTLQMHTLASTTGRLRDEFWRRSLGAIGLRVQFKSDRFSDILKAARAGNVQMFESNWIADYPDAENFYQLLYSGNIGRANYARFHLPQYDLRFEQSQALPDGPARTTLYRQMNQLIEGYAPWVVRTFPLEAALVQPWLLHYRRHPVENTVWRYLDIDHGVWGAAP